MNKLKYLSLISLFTVVSCSSNIPSVNENLSQTQNIVFDAGYKNGSDISVKLNLNSESFQVKDSTNGTSKKTKADVKSLELRLIKSTSANGFPDDGDLTAASVTTSSSSFDKTNQSSYTFNFKNVPASGKDGSNLPYYYYATVTAYDGVLPNGTPTGKRIVKIYNGSTTANWNTGDTDTYYARLGISTNGVIVGDDYKVSTPTPLEVTLNLEDAQSASIQGLISPKSGSDNLPATSIN